MMAGIEAVRPGEPLGNIGKAIQKIAEGADFRWCEISVDMDLDSLFAEPQILHYYDASSDKSLWSRVCSLPSSQWLTRGRSRPKFSQMGGRL